MPGIKNILVSRQDSNWRGAEGPLSPTEDVLHSLCMSGASKPPCILSPLCAFPFAAFCPALLSGLSEVCVMPVSLAFSGLPC